MLKVLKIAAAALSVAAFSLAGSPGWGEPQPTEYGFPITEIPSDDLPCHMVTPSGHTLNLVRLCGGGQQTVALPSQKQSATEAAQPVSTPRKRLDSSKYLSQYQQLAERYPDSKVVERLASMDKMPYAESVCERLSTGLTVEKIRTEDIQKLQSDPSGNLTLDNARKQNIEITLKLAPQYYCPEGTP